MYLKIAEALAEESKCVSLKVGAVLVKDNNIISCGINGTPKGSKNCCEVHKDRGEEHSKWSELHEVHAEANAILRCNTDKTGATMYITCAPCINCLKHCNASGIKTFIYSAHYYRISQEDWERVIGYAISQRINLYLFKDNTLILES